MGKFIILKFIHMSSMYSVYNTYIHTSGTMSTMRTNGMVRNSRNVEGKNAYIIYCSKMSKAKHFPRMNSEK